MYYHPTDCLGRVCAVSWSSDVPSSYQLQCGLGNVILFWTPENVLPSTQPLTPSKSCSISTRQTESRPPRNSAGSFTAWIRPQSQVMTASCWTWLNAAKVCNFTFYMRSSLCAACRKALTHAVHEQGWVMSPDLNHLGIIISIPWVWGVKCGGFWRICAGFHFNGFVWHLSGWYVDVFVFYVMHFPW